MNQFDLMRQAINEARTTMNAADSVANDMASLLRGRLRRVDSGYILAQLKMELSDFNAHTKRWKT